MRCRIWGLARPVRTVANSLPTCSTACSIVCSASRRRSPIIRPSSLVDHGADLLAAHRFHDVPRHGHVEYMNGNTVLFAHGNCGGVHDLEFGRDEIHV